MANNETNTLLEQNDAMESYLNDMLSTLVLEPSDESANSTMRLVQPQPTDVDDQRIEAERIEAERIEAERIEADQKYRNPNAPDWAANRFKAVVVVVNNVKLAFPIELIKEQISFDGELKQVKGQLDWVLGLKMDGANFIAVVDTGNLLLNQAIRDVKIKPYHTILLLKKSRWGIACDSISDEVLLDSAAIKWREKASDKQWLRGFESNQQLAIIDPEKMFIDDK